MLGGYYGNTNNIPEEQVVETAFKSKAKSIWGLVLGILSLPGALGGFGPIIGIPGWIVSLVMAIVAKVLVKKEPDSGLKKGAKITSAIALVLNIITVVLFVLEAAVLIILSFTGVIDGWFEALGWH